MTAILDREPDRGTQAFRLGPRVIVSKPATEATRLIQPGSLIRYQYRLALPPEEVLGEWRAKLDERFPGAGWRIGMLRTRRREYSGLSTAWHCFCPHWPDGVVGRRSRRRDAVRSFMDSRVRSCNLEMPGRDECDISDLRPAGWADGVDRYYHRSYCRRADTGCRISTLEGRLPVTAEFGFIRAAIYGGGFWVLVAAIFTLWPLGLAGEVRATSLFRSNAERLSGRPPGEFILR